MKVLKIIQKNFKLLIRSKTSALVVILGPLLIVSLLGFAFSKSSSYNVNVGVYSEEFNALSESLTDKMRDNQFTIIKFNSEQACINELEEGKNQICVGFPKDFEIKEGGNNNINYHVDYSKINLAYLITDMIGTKVSNSSSVIRKNLTQDLLTRISTIEDETTNNLKVLNLLRFNTNEIGQIMDQINAKMQATDLTFDSSSLDIGAIKSKTNQIIGKIDNLNETTIPKLLEAQDNAKDLSSSVNDSRLQEIKTNINESLEEIDDAYVDILRYSNETLNLLNTLEDGIGDVETKFSNAQEAKDISLNKANEAKKLVNENINMINQLETSFTKIQESISGISIRNADLISEPITTTIIPVVKEKTHFSNAFPTLVVLILMITGILLASALMITEKKSRAAFRNFLTPTSVFAYDIGAFITSLIWVMVQLVVFVAVAGYFFKVKILESLGQVIILLILIASLYIIIGMLIGTFFRTEETNTLAAITVSSIFLFFSSTVLPLESMPITIQNIAKYNPFVISELLLKQGIFFQYTFQQLLPWILVIIEYIIGIFVVLLIVQYIIRKKFFHRFHMKAK